MGVSWADWEPGLAARRADREAGPEELPRVGPEQIPAQLRLTLEEVLPPACERGRLHALRSACSATADGHRYLREQADQAAARARPLVPIGSLGTSRLCTS